MDAAAFLSHSQTKACLLVRSCGAPLPTLAARFCPLDLSAWLPSSRAPRGQLDLRRAQDADDRGNRRRKLRRISDSRLWRPFDEYRGGRVGWLDQLDGKLIGLSDRPDRQKPI